MNRVASEHNTGGVGNAGGKSGFVLPATLMASRFANSKNC
jgi:hypothetical protein